MSERTSSGELEREAEQIRAGIAQTAEALQDRMSPGKMVDEFMAYMKDSDGSLAMDNLRKQARDNPMALAMIGSGFAWLMFGGGGSGSTAVREPKVESKEDREGGRLTDAAFAAGDAANGIADKASDIVDRARDVAGQAADRIRGAAGQASDHARRLGLDATDRGYAAADDVRDMADRGRRTVMDALDREPLVLGAIGVAVGAALGAMLPGTRFENDAFGKTRDSLMRGAEDVVDRAAETARNVAGEAVQAAKAASKDEGLVIDGKAITERVGDVAKAALSAGREAADRDMTSSEGGEPSSRKAASPADNS